MTANRIENAIAIAKEEKRNQPKSVFKNSDYQQAIFQFLQFKQGNLIVEAYAGCGKTSTLVGIANLFNINTKMLFLAFNAKIKDELVERLPSHCEASTFHSWGLRAIPGQTRVNKWKTINYIQELFGITKKSLPLSKELQSMVDLLKQVVSLAKSYAISPDEFDIHKLCQIADDFAIDLNGHNLHEVVERTKTVLARCITNINEVCFDDMLYVPCIHKMHTNTKYDYILVDESQDLNTTQIQLLINYRESNPNCRFVFVGDPNQAIYGFRGAGVDTFPMIQREFATEKLPLSKSYRCSKAVIRDAQRFVPEIEFADTNIEGFVLNDCNIAEVADSLGGIINESFILSRKNAPLVPIAYSLLAREIPATIIGADILKMLNNTIKSIVGKRMETSIPAFLEGLDSFIDAKVELCIKRNQQKMADTFHDLYEIFVNFIHNGRKVENVEQLAAKIAELFSDEDGNVHAVKLMTCHKAKGLETNYVFILNDFAVKTKTAWQEDQEMNLKYVAATRAKIGTVYFTN